MSLLLAYKYFPLFDIWISPAAISELSSFSRRVEIVENGVKFPRSSDFSEVIVDANSEIKKKKGDCSEDMSFLKVVICLGPVPAGRVTLNGISLGTSR